MRGDKYFQIFRRTGKIFIERVKHLIRIKTDGGQTGSEPRLTDGSIETADDIDLFARFQFVQSQRMVNFQSIIIVKDYDTIRAAGSYGLIQIPNRFGGGGDQIVKSDTGIFQYFPDALTHPAMVGFRRTERRKFTPFSGIRSDIKNFFAAVGQQSFRRQSSGGVIIVKKTGGVAQFKTALKKPFRSIYSTCAPFCDTWWQAVKE